MKKVFFILGMLLSLGMFCACSNSDEIENESPNDLGDLIPVEEGEDFDAISEFFQTEIGPDGYGSCMTYNEKPFNLKNNLRKDENPCIVINNEEDFKEAYTGDLSLPAIDFSNYTLIIGKIFLPAGEFIDNMSIKQTNPVKATLSINCIIDTNPNVGYIGRIYWNYYWKLFPKFHASEISVEINKEYGIVDNNKK